MPWSEVVLDCPHCRTERVTFEIVGTRFVADGNNLFASCRKCHQGVVATIVYRGPAHSSTQRVNLLPARDYKLVNLIPKPASNQPPNHVPEAIAQDYKEAAASLLTQRYTAAGMMFRKVLQRATTALATAAELDFQRIPLRDRIDQLADQHLITPAMRDWGHLIRLEGNSATHDEDEVFEQSDAEQMQAFTELFLIYAFTLPERVKLARETSTNTDQSA